MNAELRGNDAMLGPFHIVAGRLVRGVDVLMRDIARSTGTTVEVDVAGGLLQKLYSVTFWGTSDGITEAERLVRSLGLDPE